MFSVQFITDDNHWLDTDMTHTINAENYGHKVNMDMDGLLQDYSNSSASAMELPKCCTKPFTYNFIVKCRFYDKTYLPIFL